MKTNLKKMLGLAALGMTLLSNIVPTWAGTVSAPEVSIYTDNNGYQWAKGSMVGARYSADSKQSIGCGILFSPPSIGCYAQDNAGHYLGCSSNDPKHLDALQGMTDSSRIEFEMERDNVHCKFIVNYTGSYLLK